MNSARTQVLDILLGLKAITLSDLLNGNQKRVGTTLLDHYNRRTGQCDPSLETVAVLLGISRRTVIRAVSRLERVGFIRKVRHGGHFHRNHHEPVWQRFREEEAKWKHKRALHAARFGSSKVSLSQGQASHHGGATAVTQTCLINRSEETSANQRESSNDSERLSKRKNKTSENLKPTFHVKRTPSHEAANDAATRRWNAELSRAFADKPALFGKIIDELTPEFQDEATLAELRTVGAGWNLIVNRLLMGKLPKGEE